LHSYSTKQPATVDGSEVGVMPNYSQTPSVVTGGCKNLLAFL